MSRTDAVEALYQDMAARHRARFGSISVCILSDSLIPNPLSNPLSQYRSSRSSRSTTPRTSAAPTSSSSSPRTSSSLCLTALPSLLARRSSPTRGHLPSHKCDVRGFGSRSVWMNNNDTAIACNEDIKHAENTACIYHSENGKDGFDVTLVLCSDGFSSLYHKKQNLGFLFSVHDFSRPWCIQCLNDDVAFFLFSSISRE